MCKLTYVYFLYQKHSLIFFNINYLHIFATPMRKGATILKRGGSPLCFFLLRFYLKKLLIPCTN